jgi:DNA-binding protein HU-beta
MKHKEFIDSISKKTGIDSKKAESLSEITCQIMTDMLSDGDSLSIQGLGAFIVKKREERLSVIPSTQKRLLIPPKIVPGFKPGPLLKEKIKNLSNHE